MEPVAPKKKHKHEQSKIRFLQPNHSSIAGVNEEEVGLSLFGATDPEFLMITPDSVAVPPLPPPLLSPKGREQRRTRSQDSNILCTTRLAWERT
jgi:hypothetical protein